MTAEHSEQGPKGRDETFFFYKGQKIVSPNDSATGLEIKQLIHASVPTFDVQHTLVLEGQGHNGSDREIKDGEIVSLKVGHGEGPKHFYSKPPTNFG